MTDLYLIAHKVRGEPAFDVACKLECPECEGTRKSLGIQQPDGLYRNCHECDSTGFWWIIPTSGHRAYPWWDIELNELCERCIHDDIQHPFLHDVPPMPEGLPDHYTTRAAPRIDLATALGLRAKPAAALPPLPRRL